MKVGRVTVSDRASKGVYEDRSGPEIERVLLESWGNKDLEFLVRLIPDERAQIEALDHIAGGCRTKFLVPRVVDNAGYRW
jgi:molybdopterin adenylyltransferase